MPTSEYSLTYLALGDSYTIGEGVEAAERWPAQLVTALRAQSISIADPEIIARTGWTTANLLTAIERQYAGEEHDLVSLLIGVNDQYQGLSVATYRQEFKELLTFAIQAAGGRASHVIVVSIPDWGFTPFAETVERPNISIEIDAFNAVNREESAAAGVHYFDITATTRPLIFDRQLFAEDGLHPSTKMYAQWVELIFPHVFALLTGTK